MQISGTESSVEVRDVTRRLNLKNVPYCTRVMYAYDCLQTTTLGPEILAVVTSACWLKVMKKYKHVARILDKHVLPGLYVFNVGLLITIWFTCDGNTVFREVGVDPFGVKYTDDDPWYNDDNTDDSSDPPNNPVWVPFYLLFLTAAFVVCLAYFIFDLVTYFLVVWRLPIAYELGLVFWTDQEVGKYSNTFIEVGRTEKIKYLDTDLKDYALFAFLESSSKIKIMFATHQWRAKNVNYLSLITPVSTTAVWFSLINLCGTALAVKYDSYPIRWLWWIFMWANVVSVAFFVVKMILVVTGYVLLFASLLVNLALCGLPGCLYRWMRERTKAEIIESLREGHKADRLSFIDSDGARCFSSA